MHLDAVHFFVSTGGNTMGFLQVVALLRAIFAVPDVHDGPALRAWIGSLADIAKRLVDMSATEADDMALDALVLIVDNDEVWEFAHGMILRVVGGNLPAGCDGCDCDWCDDDEAAAAKVGTPGISPIVILSVISTVIQLIRMWRNR